MRITNEASRSLPGQIMVELGSPTGGVIQTTYSDPEGRASFTATAGRTYQIKVSGVGIEQKVVSFDVQPGESFHHEYISVKTTTDSAASLPGGIVSASMLNVPEKARREFDKGIKDFESKKWEDAKKHFEKATKEYPNFDWAFNNIGVADIQLHDQQGAREAFQRAVSINDKNPDATKNLARLLIEDSKFDEAKGLLLKSNSVQPGNPDTLVLLAYSQMKTHDLDAALANAEKCHRSDPDHYPLGHLIAAAVRETKGDLAGAEKQYQTYLKEAPDTPQAQAAKQGLARIQSQASN
ncbi:MAG TPA: tetratricopeptide repeat protein [Terriglobales bacterium]